MNKVTYMTYIRAYDIPQLGNELSTYISVSSSVTAYIIKTKI